MIAICAPYLEWIRTQPCLINYYCNGPVEAAHLQARGTEEHKRVDYYAIPLCSKHHREQHSKTVAELSEKYGIDLWREVARLECMWILALNSFLHKIEAQLDVVVEKMEAKNE